MNDGNLENKLCQHETVHQSFFTITNTLTRLQTEDHLALRSLQSSLLGGLPTARAALRSQPVSKLRKERDEDFIRIQSDSAREPTHPIDACCLRPTVWGNKRESEREEREWERPRQKEWVGKICPAKRLLRQPCVVVGTKLSGRVS